MFSGITSGLGGAFGSMGSMFGMGGGGGGGLFGGGGAFGRMFSDGGTDAQSSPATGIQGQPLDMASLEALK